MTAALKILTPPVPQSPPRPWVDCAADTDRSLWGPKVRRFMDYWLTLAAPGRLPGRRQFDPLHIHSLMPHVWMLDVVRDNGGIRFRYRLVGTKEVETLQRDVTGMCFEEAHGGSAAKVGTQDRFRHMVEHRVATYRKGPVVLTHHKDHQVVENCMAPLASDGANVDIIVACSTLFWSDGTEA
jgi:hypothetical protein